MEKLKLKYQDKLPKLLLDFHQAFKNKYAAEYEFIEDSNQHLRSITNNDKIEDEFYLILRNPVGSLYGFWILDESNFSKNPIVQFSRDGIFAVLAADFNQFISQLYLLGADAWQLSEFISTITNPIFEEDFSALTLDQFVKKYPSIKISQKDIEQHIKTVIDDFGGKETLAWLEEHKIAELESSKLFDTIVETYLRYPNLQNFLDKRI